MTELKNTPFGHGTGWYQSEFFDVHNLTFTKIARIRELAGAPAHAQFRTQSNKETNEVSIIFYEREVPWSTLLDGGEVLDESG